MDRKIVKNTHRNRGARPCSRSLQKRHMTLHILRFPKQAGMPPEHSLPEVRCRARRLLAVALVRPRDMIVVMKSLWVKTGFFAK